MDLITSLLVITLVGFIVWVLAILCLDADVATFLYSHFGKSLDDAFAGKVVWLTGASGGIGEGLAKELAKHQAKLVLTARRLDELNRVKRECLDLGGNLQDEDILVVQMDMTDYSAHQPIFDKILKHFGKLDILISNAGRTQRANWEEVEPQVDKELFDLNVFSLLSVSRIVLKYFYGINKGHLVVMSSVAGKNGLPFSPSYIGSKFALHGYFESLRNEIAGIHKSIRVTMICPGPVFSGVVRNAFTAHKDEKFGQDVRPDDKRMTAERCAHLSLVGIANELEECWMSLFPFLQLTYLSHYQPYLAGKLWQWLSASGRIMKFRDGRDTMKKES